MKMIWITYSINSIMKKDILIRYRDNNQELDLLGALEQKGLNDYNDEYKKLIEILLLMLSITEKNGIPIQQFLFYSIYRKLDDIVASEDNLREFVDVVSGSINEDNDNISAFIFRFIVNIKDDLKGIGAKKNIDSLKRALEQINVTALGNAIRDEKKYSLIADLLYSCVSDMEADRKIILHTDAIKKFRDYILKNPTGYLKYFIRPYYSMGPRKESAEYYLHVEEPFRAQIFGNDFENFLAQLDKEDGLVSDIIAFYDKVFNHRNKEDKVVMLFSYENKESISAEKHLRLTSDEHEFVHHECLPPNYRSVKQESEL